MTRHPYTWGIVSILGTLIGLTLLWTAPAACANLTRCAIAWLILRSSLPGWIIPTADTIARHLSDIIEEDS